MQGRDHLLATGGAGRIHLCTFTRARIYASKFRGVIVARVHVVLPEKVAPGEPLQLSSAAVLIKHQSILDPDVASPKIKRIVASSIPGLADGER